MKKIAIVGWSTGPQSFGIGKFYADLIAEEGGTPIIIMPNMDEDYHKKLAEEVDLLILPGGADLSPSLYGEAPNLFTGNNDVFKEHFFKENLKHYVHAKTPIFGICLGFQMINVLFGGKLVQHLKYSDIHASDKRGGEAHKVRTITGEIVPVNSHHHQAVTLDTISKELIPLAFSHLYDKTLTAIEQKNNPELLLVEAFKHKTLPIAGVQWHPEEWFDTYSRGMIRRLLSVRERKTKSV